MEQRITVDSILDKKFSTVAKGFNQQEVDEYLTKQKEDLTAQVNSLKASAKSYYEQAQNALNGLSKLL